MMSMKPNIGMHSPFPVLPEMASRIFQSCDTFADVLALSMSCKRLRSLFLSNCGTIIWEVGKTSVLSFHEALICMRATKAVNEAYLAGELAPSIDLPSLSGRVRKPTLAELQETLDLRYYVRFLEYKLLLPKHKKTTWGGGAKPLIHESPQLLPIWKENLHRAIYRFFIAGASLCRPFQEPFFFRPEGFDGDDEDDEGFFEVAIRSVNDGSWDYFEGGIELPVTEDQMDVLNTFPAYNFTPHPDWEACFGHLGDWLVGETRKRLSREQEDDVNSDGEDEAARSSERAVLREVMQLLVAYGQLCDMDGGIWDTGAPFWAQNVRGNEGKCKCYLHWMDKKDDNEAVAGNIFCRPQTPPSSRRRKVTVVFCGDFEPRELKIADVTDFNETMFARRIDEPDRDPRGPVLRNIDIFTSVLHCMSGRPNHVGGHPLPHPPLHFFTFLLRKHFGYQFSEHAFRVNSPHPSYEKFIQQGEIFATDGDWEGLLASADVEQVLGYDEIKMGDCG